MLPPVDTTITEPAADVPAEFAPFSGAWGGVWTDRAGHPRGVHRARRHGRERCHQVYRDGETLTFHVHDRWTVFRWTRTAGHPANL